MYLAIDLGTTGCRSIVFDDKLNQIAASYEEYGLITTDENWIEQDANLWWELTLKTSEDAIKKAKIKGEDILGISVSAQGITVLPVDENVNPLCNAINWLDVRAKTERDKIEADFGREELFTHTGKYPGAGHTLAKLLWLKENRNEIFTKAYKFLLPMDFLIAKFTGKFVTDHSMASGTLMHDIKNCCWSKDILEKYDIPEEKLPELSWSGEPVGYVLKEVREKLSLNEKCIVAVGAQDQKCAALGAGLNENTMTISLGTAGAITKKWDNADTENSRKITWCGYVQKGAWVTEGVITTAGTCLRWVRDLYFKGEEYDVINKEAKESIDAGSELMFYPYLGGPSAPEFYPDAKGCFYGISLTTKRGCFAAAVMEGIAFNIRMILEAMDAYKNVDKVILFGGGAKSDLWSQIIADVTGMEIHVPNTAEAAGAGAAMLAAKACGNKINSLEISKSFKPSDKQTYYAQKYNKYREIEKKLWQKGDIL